VTLGSGDRLCLPTCDPGAPACPRAFSCVPGLSSTTVCRPSADVCCIDEDADGYGSGRGCTELDCNDADIDVNPAAPELCNGVDDDCDGVVDDLATDCGEQRCVEASAGGFEEVAPGACVEGRCADGARTSCGLYACSGGGSTGTTCATGCVGSTGIDDDALCARTAHCESGVCEPDVPNGGACDEDTDCVSSHCDNGFCCNAGICCNAATDCPVTGGGFIAVCEDAANCQGTRGAATCADFVCGTISGVPDDSGCTASVLADECGFFRPVYCNGSANQTPPRCPSTCRSDDECDDNAHCDDVCLPDVRDGDSCDENSDCISGYCNNGICCAGGDCCRNPADCPARYSRPARCEAPASCQGSRDAASCVANVCGTITNVPDDSACSPAVMANDCGPYPARFCSGGTDQPEPVCPSSCTVDAECDPNAHCDGNACVPDLENGRMCDENSDCISGYCGNGFCCATGDCCNMASDCPAAVYGRPSVCTNVATCQGDRVDPVCTPTKQCAIGPTVGDDSGCAGREADNCGTYPSVFCTAAVDQPPPMCRTSCMSDGDCDPTAFCNAMGQCQSRGMPGAACGTTSECGTGLTCVDGVCCTSACTGTCRACNLPGSEGTCTNIPAGQDPAEECGAVSCAAYFIAPMGAGRGAQCNQVADVPAGAVQCNGAAACQNAATLCPPRTVPGPMVLDCDDTCQTLSGCTGTTPGRCDPFTPVPNTQSCGTGECSRTVAICESGGALACVPGMPVPEVCDGRDNNCNDQIDEGLSGDAFEPNNSCAAARTLMDMGTVNDGSRVSIQTINPTIYGAGDVDVFRVNWVENDSTCTCENPCLNPFGCDEDYRMVAQLTVPAGAGSYQVCVRGGGTCGDGACTTVMAGTTGSANAVIDGGCSLFGSDSGTFWITVRGAGAPAFQCNSYALRLELQQACVSGN
jgi:hypothetical protein